MDDTKNSNSCMSAQSCKVSSMVSVDDRGQMVLPKDLRDKAGINAGDKMALVTWENNGKVCCIAMIKADELGSMVSDFLGPMMGTNKS